jgi:hypothetical protein
MKLRIASVLAVIVLGVTACGGGSSKSVAQSPVSSPSAATLTPTVAPIFSVNDCVDISSNSFHGDTTGSGVSVIFSVSCASPGFWSFYQITSVHDTEYDGQWVVDPCNLPDENFMDDTTNKTYCISLRNTAPITAPAIRGNKFVTTGNAAKACAASRYQPIQHPDPWKATLLSGSSNRFEVRQSTAVCTTTVEPNGNWTVDWVSMDLLKVHGT